MLENNKKGSLFEIAPRSYQKSHTIIDCKFVIELIVF